MVSAHKRSKFIFLLLTVFFSSKLFATTSTSDLTDLWYNANESGWGVNVIHQRDIAFLTVFVYGQDGRSTWYVGPNTNFRSLTNGVLTMSGPLYTTTGPWFGGSFDPARVGVRQVGTITFTANTLTSASVNYVVDGVSTTKIVSRQTWATNDLTGQYTGAVNYVASGCNPSINNGSTFEAADLSITNTNTTLNMVSSSVNAICTYSGTYIQTGKLGSSTGNYSCNNGVRGTYSMFEIQANITGITGRVSAQNNFCASIGGRFGALRR